jgi:hypothetical protein
MTIKFLNGTTKEAVMLSRTPNALRVATQGSDDALELRQVNGTWITDDCEPVHVAFAWEMSSAPEVTEADCICSPELAARLIRVLHSDEASIAAPTGSTLSQMESVRFEHLVV